MNNSNGNGAVRDAAAEYLRRRWLPVPLKGKVPSGGDGWQEQRFTEADLDLVFSNGTNIGVLMGKPSEGLADVDLDCPEALILAAAFLPKTSMMFGRGDLTTHWLYQLTPADFPRVSFEDPVLKATRPGADGKKPKATVVELRGTGVQTMMPPSVHPETKEIVTWRMHGELTALEHGALFEHVSQFAAACLLARYWGSCSSREETAMALAGALLRSGWDEKNTYWFIEQVCIGAKDEERAKRVAAARQTAKKIMARKPTTGGKTCRNIFGEKVWDKIVEWLQLTGAYEVEWDQIAPLAHVEVPPFPTDVLPSWCAEFVNGISHAMQTPPDLAGGFVRSGLSLALARKLRVFLRKGFYERVNIYTVCILPPAERKSPVFEAAFRCIEDYEQALNEELAPIITADETSFKILEARAKRTQSDAATQKDPAKRLELTQQAKELAEELRTTKIQVAPRLIADDCTPERLSTLLCEQGGRMAELSPEGGIFDIMAGRYAAKGKPPNIDVYLKAHSGDTLRVDRIGRPPDHVRDPALTVGLAAQPAVLRSLVSNPEFRGRGLLARFFYLLPVSRLGSRDTTVEGIDEAVQATYDRNLKQLLRLDYDLDADGSPIPHILRFDDSALLLMRGWEAEIEPLLGPANELGGIADWGGKLFGATARFAALLHMAERVEDANPWRSAIGAKTTENAIRLARYFIVHAQAAFSEMGADPAVEKARLILDWIRRKGLTEFSKRDAQQILKGRLIPSAELDASLLLLVEHGYIRAQVVSGKRHRGRPGGPRFEVNPNIGDSGDCRDTYPKNGPSGQVYPKDPESSGGEREKDLFTALDTTPQYPQNPQNSGTSPESPEGEDRTVPSSAPANDLDGRPLRSGRDEEEDLT